MVRPYVNCLSLPPAHGSPRYLTTGELANLAGVSQTVIRKWCNGGKLPCLRIGGKIATGQGDRRFRIPDVLKFLRERGFVDAATTLLHALKPATLTVEMPARVVEVVRQALLPYQTAVHDYQHPVHAAAAIPRCRPALLVVNAVVGAGNVAALHGELARTAEEVGVRVGVVVYSDSEVTAVGAEDGVAATPGDVWHATPATFTQATLTAFAAAYLPLRMGGYGNLTEGSNGHPG